MDAMFAKFLEKKYKIMESEANAQNAARYAQARLNSTQAALAPNQAAAENNYRDALASKAFNEADIAGPVAQSEIDYRGAQGRLAGAQADFFAPKTALMERQTTPANRLLFSSSPAPAVGTGSSQPSVTSQIARAPTTAPSMASGMTSGGSGGGSGGGSTSIGMIDPFAKQAAIGGMPQLDFTLGSRDRAKAGSSVGIYSAPSSSFTGMMPRLNPGMMDYSRDNERLARGMI